MTTDTIDIPAPFWSRLSKFEFLEIMERGALDAGQCIKVWEMLGREGEPPRSMSLHVSSVDIKRLWPAKKGGGMTYLDLDKAVSLLARRWLRGLSDLDLAWLPFLSRPHRELVCRHLDTSPAILRIAQRYESLRRRLYPAPREVLVNGERRLIHADGKMTTLGGMEIPLQSISTRPH